VQIWSDVICYDAADQHYGPAKALNKTNDEVLEVLSPVADYLWHDRYQAQHGPETGGMLLNAWIEELAAAAADLAECELSSSPCRGVLSITGQLPELVLQPD
jgi:hypothetical protein